jgi:hypothetical protein
MNNTTDRPSLLSLAESVSNITKAIASHLEETSHEASNFTASSPDIPTTQEYERLRIDLNMAALDLLRLVNGPKVELRNLFTKPFEIAAWQVALEYDYFNVVPLEGTISLQELAAKAGMNENRTLQIMRFLTTQRVFRELAGKSDDEICFEHTSGSATIAREPLLKDAFLMQADEMFRAASSASDSVRESPFEIKTDSSPFSVRHGDMPYKWYEKHPAQAGRFSRAMKGLTLRNSTHSQLMRYAKPMSSRPTNH